MFSLYSHTFAVRLFISPRCIDGHAVDLYLMSNKMTRKTVLIFGGNGFLGSETVAHLIKTNKCNISLINRGRSWDWGWKEKILPDVARYFKWDRRKPLKECSEFMRWFQEVESIDCVVDFSGYEPNYIADATETIHAKTKLYIFISTDSVYEVCEKRHERFTSESDDTRPKDRVKRKRLKRRDSYGYKKWKCEHILKKCADLNHVILRLADVVGPRDSTDRWWQYQLWLKAASICGLPLYIPQPLEGKNLSLVYVSDVAGVITNIVTSTVNLQHVANNAFNLAFQETPTLQGLLLKISSRIQGIDTCCKIIFTSNTEVPHIYPSVENGPIDITKSKSLLNWDPTPLDEAVDRTVIFYENLQNQSGYEDSKHDMFETLCEDLSDLYSEVQFVQLRKELKEILSIE
ncbi:hypothetical protein LSH36_204g08008 [Paralvinella palmiformis]|uniref:NAD-dependent epimerase/dehydratase domain-containing protein n=1 Tax=Paralvinella palmiformis TaxID=53620 RepID=A0AAD9N4V2_9ANNE|nr:hypothetical protein LSH36_204g08008 [Paralvinella palmiformis]